MNLFNRKPNLCRRCGKPKTRADWRKQRGLWLPGAPGPAMVAPLGLFQPVGDDCCSCSGNGNGEMFGPCNECFLQVPLGFWVDFAGCPWTNGHCDACEEAAAEYVLARVQFSASAGVYRYTVYDYCGNYDLFVSIVFECYGIAGFPWRITATLRIVDPSAVGAFGIYETLYNSKVDDVCQTWDDLAPDGTMTLDYDRCYVSGTAPPVCGPTPCGNWPATISARPQF